MSSRSAARHGQMTLLEEDPHTRRSEDYYSTFRWQTAALLQRVRLNPQWTFLEPCAGEGAIVKLLAPKIGVVEQEPLNGGRVRIWSNDLVHRNWPLHSVSDARQHSTWESIEQANGPIDVVITNLPFGVAFEVIQLAWAYARVAVITLLRHTWDEPTQARNEWLAAHPLTSKIVLPRAKYRGGSGSESATHSWFIWTKPEWRHTLQPHHTVTIRECVNHALAYGEDPSTIAGWTAMSGRVQRSND